MVAREEATPTPFRGRTHEFVCCPGTAAFTGEWDSAATPVAPRRTRSNTVTAEGVPLSEDFLRYREHVRADPAYDWKQPISFYGKVVDENNQPVA